MSGCHDARNAITIYEVPCPKCGEEIEVFVKDGTTCVESSCPQCGHAIPQSTPIGELRCG